VHKNLCHFCTPLWMKIWGVGCAVHTFPAGKVLSPFFWLSLSHLHTFIFWELDPIHTPSCFLPFLLSCNLFSARFNFLVTGRKHLLRLGFQVLMSSWHIKLLCLDSLLCSPESWIVVNSHIIQIRIDLCAPLQTALYMPRTCLPPNVDVVFKIHVHLML
jgi:hypothetical protein